MLFFAVTFRIQKGTKMADHILESSLKTILNTTYRDVFIVNKKVDKF